MNDIVKVEYRVRKITREVRFCPVCGGKKTVEINLGQHQHKTVTCSTCTGTGVYYFERPDEISLVEALTELGIRFILPASMKPTSEQK